LFPYKNVCYLLTVLLSIPLNKLSCSINSTKAGQQNLPETETSDEEAQIDNEHESLEKGIVDMNISEQAKEDEQIMNA
jgi:hypothetical protein